MADNKLDARAKRVSQELLDETSGILYTTYSPEDTNRISEQLIHTYAQDATNAILMAARHLLLAIAYDRDKKDSYYDTAQRIQEGLGWENWQKLYNIDNLPPGYRIAILEPGVYVTGPEGVNEYPERLEALKKAAYNVIHPEEPLGFTPLEEVHLMSWYKSFFSEKEGGTPFDQGGYRQKVDRDPAPPNVEDEDDEEEFYGFDDERHEVSIEAD